MSSQSIQHAYSTSNPTALAQALSEYIEAHSVVYELWEKALEEQKYDLADVFMASDIGITEDVWDKIITQPIHKVKHWMDLFDTWQHEEEKIEGWAFLHRTLFKGASVEVLDVVFHSQSYKNLSQHQVPLPWLSLLVHSRSPQATWSLPQDQEDRLRQEVWKTMTPQKWLATAQSIGFYAISEKMLVNCTKLKPSVSFHEAFVLWEPEMRSWPTEKIEEWVTMFKDAEGADVETSLLFFFAGEYQAWLPGLSELLVRLEKECLWRDIEPHLLHDSPSKKHKL